MNFDTKHYEINGLKIEWGVTLREVRTLLDTFDQFKSYDGSPNIRYKCSGIFGLQTTEVILSAPFENRPVLQVEYEIAPIKTKLFEKLHSPYFKQLKKVLGKPDKSEKEYSQPHLKREYISSAVVFSATWLLDDVRISLSVYGGTRSNESGLCAAGIFIDWVDEIKAAQPYREERGNFEKLMADHIDPVIAITTFKLAYKQRPFWVVDYELSDPYIAEKDADLRAAQLVLYKQELYHTPGSIQSQLEENEVGFYKIQALDKTFISNKWDTVSLAQNDKEALVYYEVLPARGPGERELVLKEMTLTDSKDSSALLSLVELIEKETGLQVKRSEKYDD